VVRITKEAMDTVVSLYERRETVQLEGSEIEGIRKVMVGLLEKVRGGKIGPDVVRGIIENMETPPSDANLFVLGSLFSAFNRMGITVTLQYQNRGQPGKIQLT